MRVAIGVEYAGNAFDGWQTQPGGKTVQDALERALPKIKGPVFMHLGANDRTLPAFLADQACALMPQAVKLSFAGLGHLAHEEAPARTSAQILEWIRQTQD